MLLPPDYDGEIPEGYLIARSPGYIQWLILRGILVDGKPDAASHMFRNGLNVYPFSAIANPPTVKFINGTGKEFDTVHVQFDSH